MKLLLASAGNTNRSIEKALIKLLTKPVSTSHLAFIPTAAHPEKGDKAWLVDDMYNFKKLGFEMFDIVDIASVEKSVWMEGLKNADVIAVGGGNTFYLMDWIRKSGLEEELGELLKTKIYVGISAGSMCVTPDLLKAASEDLYFEEVHHGNSTKGLGIVTFCFLPHLNSEWFQHVRIENIEKYMSTIPKPLYVIDDQSAIQVVNQDITVISEGQWKKFE